MKEKKDKHSTEPAGASELPRFDKQIKRLRTIVNEWGKEVKVYRAPFVDDEGRRAFMRRVEMGPRRGGRASIVPTEDCAVELGPPSRANVNMVLWTTDLSLVRDGEIRLLGDDMPKGNFASLPYAQVVVLGLKQLEDIDPFMLESTQFLSNRLKGFMVRTIPGRLWARVSKEAVAQGMDFARLGCALICAYREDFPLVCAVEVLFVTRSDEDVKALEPLSAEARIIMGKNKKLVLVGDGEYECTDLNCDDCEEQEVCDEVRDIVILRRRRKKEDESRGHH